jgi:hypothetical protein
MLGRREALHGLSPRAGGSRTSLNEYYQKRYSRRSDALGDRPGLGRRFRRTSDR